MKQVKYFDEELCETLLDMIEGVDDCYYVDKTPTISVRTKDGSTGSYKSMLNKTIPISIRQLLIENAPHIDDHWLAEIIVNKYEVGDSIPPHYDSHMYRKFIVIALSENGDGLTAWDDDEIFFEDKKGYGVEFTGTRDLHAVSPCKHKRYSIIYLYE